MNNTVSREGLRVFVRVRPPISKEIKKENAVFVTGGQSISLNSEKQEIQCTYDHVFNELSDQGSVFEKVRPLLNDVLSGINGCIFAYGQTSAGKSFTMIGPNGGQDISHCAPERLGIVPRAATYLMDTLNEKADEGVLSYEVKASFLQIYNENLYDLLRDSGPAIEDKLLQSKGGNTELKIREIPRLNNRSRGSAPLDVFVSGLSEFRVLTSDDIMRIVTIGTNNRMTRSTDFNFTSSRSHAVLQLTFEIESQLESGQTTIVRSKLNLVDLAGSEKIPYILENNNKHMKELTSINKSLSSLGNVIAALSSKTNRSHIPYRDSKLTRILQDSLSGNTRTVLIACVAPTVLHASETLSTLQFADRAKSVMLTVHANTIVDDKLSVAKAETEIARLKALLTHALKQLESDNNGGDFSKLIADNEKLRQENKSLKQLLRQFQQVDLSNKSNSSLLVSVREESGIIEEGDGSGDEGTNYRRLGSQRKQSQKRSSLENILRGSGPKGGSGRRQNSVDMMASYGSTANNNAAINGLVSSRSDNTMGIASVGQSNNGKQQNQRSSKGAPSSLHSLINFSYFDQPQLRSSIESTMDNAPARKQSKRSLPVVGMDLNPRGRSPNNTLAPISLSHDALPIKQYDLQNESQSRIVNEKEDFRYFNSADPAIPINPLIAKIKKSISFSDINESLLETVPNGQNSSIPNNPQGILKKETNEILIAAEDEVNFNSYLDDEQRNGKKNRSKKGKRQNVEDHSMNATADSPSSKSLSNPSNIISLNSNNISSALLTPLPAANIPPSLAAMVSAVGGMPGMGSRSQPANKPLTQLNNTNLTSIVQQQKPSQPQQQQDTGIGLTVTLQHSQEDVGRALQLFSFRLNSWGKIEVLDYEPSKRLHKCKHQVDGSIQWLDLAKKPIRELPTADQDDD